MALRVASVLERAHVAGDALGADRDVVEAAQRGGLRGVGQRRELLAQRAQVEEDRGQRVVDLVGEAGGEGADEADAVGLEQRELLLVGAGDAHDGRVEADAAEREAADRGFARQGGAVLVHELELDRRGHGLAGAKVGRELEHELPLLRMDRLHHRHLVELLERVAEDRGGGRVRVPAHDLAAAVLGDDDDSGAARAERVEQGGHQEREIANGRDHDVALTKVPSTLSLVTPGNCSTWLCIAT